MKTIVWVTAQFEAFHRWKDAPEDVSFLRNYHRHIFHVKLGKEVTHGDRQIEFIQLKRELELYIREKFEGGRFEYSCEMLASALHVEFGAYFVQVSEDGENGAIVQRD